MIDDANDLVEAWIDKFGEPPALIDEELMLPLLAEADGDSGGGEAL